MTIGPPRNLFALEMDASHSLLIGGGIGITPMLAMADTLFRAGKSFAIHYCGRRRDGMAFCTSWRIALLATASICTSARKGKIRPHEVLARTTPPLTFTSAARKGLWTGSPMRRAVAVIRPNDCIRSFNREVETGGASFTVDVPGLGVTVTVGEDETIVAALQKAGIKVKVSCEQGSAEPVSPMCAACRITATSI